MIGLPRGLVRMVGMQPGMLTVESEAGGTWQATSSRYFSKNTSQFRVEWAAVVAALQLEAGQTICLAALSPSRLLISRPGEPHYRLAAVQGPPDPWPLAVRLSQKSARVWFPLSLATGRTICRDGVLSVQAAIVPTPNMPTSGEAPSAITQRSDRSENFYVYVSLSVFSLHQLDPVPFLSLGADTRASIVGQRRSQIGLAQHHLLFGL